MAKIRFNADMDEKLSIVDDDIFMILDSEEVNQSKQVKYIKKSILGGGSFIYSNVFVSPNGNDSTGVRGDINKPFLTLEAARDAAQSGDTIRVFSGNYIVTTTATNGLSKDGVDWLFDNGAICTKSANGYYFRNLSSFSKPSNVFGEGEFTHTSTGAGGVAYIEAYSINYIFEAKLAKASASATIYLTANLSTVNINIDNILSADYAASFVYGGANFNNVNVRFNNIKSTASAAISLSGGQEYLTFIGGTIESTATSGIVINGGSNNLKCNIFANNILGVPYGISFADYGSVFAQCNFCSGVYGNGNAQIHGFTSYINQTGGEFKSTFANRVVISGGKCDTSIWDLLYYYSNSTKHITISGGVLTCDIHHCQAGLSMVSTGGEVIINGGQYISYSPEGNTRVINGGIVRIKDYRITAGGLNYAAFEGFFLQSGKLFIESFYNNINLSDAHGIVWSGGSLIIDGKIVLTNSKAVPIRATVPNLQLKVLGSYQTNRVCNNINGLHKKVKCTINAVVSTTINIVDSSGSESFVESNIATYNTTALLAQRLVSLINASGTLDVTASQDNAGVDTYFWLTADDYFDFTYSCSNITFALELANSYPFTEICGGIINENINIE